MLSLFFWQFFPFNVSTLLYQEHNKDCCFCITWNATLINRPFPSLPGLWQKQKQKLESNNINKNKQTKKQTTKTRRVVSSILTWRSEKKFFSQLSSVWILFLETKEKWNSGATKSLTKRFWEIVNSYSATEKEEVLPLSHFEKGTILVDAIHPPPKPPHPPATFLQGWKSSFTRASMTFRRSQIKERINKYF